MTEEEITKLFCIPKCVIKKFKGAGLLKSEEGGYTDEDIQNLSTYITLMDIGFSQEESKEYMCLLLSKIDTKEKTLNMLNKKRESLLSQIHSKEKQIDKIDYLKHKLK